jgi:hypothetical protein
MTSTVGVEELADRLVVRRPPPRNAILFEPDDTRRRMDAFLAGGRS